ncbi:MAG TPA: carboxypeptidase M32 [Flavitalea sp.]|nr:carboxypeptidase M32 [Flavitalea sp.]
MNTIYNEYVERMQRIADLRYSAAVLQWDQETYLPEKGAELRGRQLSTLAELSHSMFTDKTLGTILQSLKSEIIGDLEKANVSRTAEDYNRQKKLPTEFVGKLSQAINRSFHKWIEARKTDSFAVFAPYLEEVVMLKRAEAEYIGYEKHPYDALLQEFDKGSTVTELDRVFNSLKGPLKDILNSVMGQPQVNDSFLKQHFDRGKQWEFGMSILRDFGFDFAAGRQDISEHPFTTSFNPRDVRVTTRIDENDFSNMTWSCIHELGHGLYEQGLPVEQYGLPLGEAASLTIHESQSRLWENHIGRSLSFCRKYLPVLKKLFPEQFNAVDALQLYKAINKVQPSFIRTEADELTYHFHVMIRYELEKALISNQLQTEDIPAYWNEQYRELLGVEVSSDKVGCLQDVHWSHGSFGYFPTYSMGSFYATQFYRSALRQVNSNDSELNTAPILDWLKHQIHSKGRQFQSDELCVKVTGEKLNIQYFLDYLLDKYRNIYNF